MAVATITAKGQVTIPKVIRERLGVDVGDKVDFVEEEGRIVVRPATKRIGDLAGLLERPGGRAVTLEEMEAAIRRRGTRG